MYLSNHVPTYIGCWSPAACRVVPLDRSLRLRIALRAADEAAELVVSHVTAVVFAV